MTVRRTWKKFESRVAAYFGGERNPLSGGNSKHTRADVIHNDLFIECKLRQNPAIWNLYENTKEMAIDENKIPVLAIQKKNKKGFLICVHSNDFKKIIERKT